MDKSYHKKSKSSSSPSNGSKSSEQLSNRFIDLLLHRSLDLKNTRIWLMPWTIIPLRLVMMRIRRYLPVSVRGPKNSKELDYVLKFARENRVRIVYLPRLGYVISPDNLRRLLLALNADAKPRRIDRASLLLWLAGMDIPHPKDIPIFDIYMEREIRRIAKLREPFKTEQALKILLRYRDAKQVADAILKAKVEDLEAAQKEKWYTMLRKMAGVDDAYVEGEEF